VGSSPAERTNSNIASREPRRYGGGMSFFDLVGFVGIFTNLCGYFLLQNGTLTAHDGRFTVIQCSSCLMLIVSLAVNFNLSAMILNVIVVFVTIFGFVKFRLKRASGSSISPQ
jgi:hypothetical protein